MRDILEVMGVKIQSFNDFTNGNESAAEKRKQDQPSHSIGSKKKKHKKYKQTN